MRILFCNNSFPGPFEALARLLASRPEHTVYFVSCYGRRDFSINGVRRLLINGTSKRPLKAGDELLRQWSHLLAVGRAARNAFTQLENSGFAPDMVLFNAGCGEGIFVQSAFSNAFRAAYLDLDKLSSEPEIEEETNILVCQMQGSALFHAHAAYAFGSAQNLPALLKPAINLIPPFVDTDFFSPEQADAFCLDGRYFSRDLELLSFNMKGFNDGSQNGILAETLKQILRLRPQCQILLSALEPACPFYAAAQELARTYPGRVHDMAIVSRALYRDMLVASNIRVLPGSNCLARDFLEPMSCRTLLVAHSDFAGMTFLPGKTMLLWPQSGADQINLLMTVLDNKQVAEHLRGNAWQAVQEYSQERVLSRHIEDLLTASQNWQAQRERIKRGY